MNAERQLRLVQVACILLVVACILVTNFGKHERPDAITITQWLVIVSAIWTAVSGFTVQRRIVRPRPGSGRSTPFSRWRAGHMLRLWSAAMVGAWALVLHEIGGPAWLVDTLFTLGLLLLLTWRPGASPATTQL